MKKIVLSISLSVLLASCGGTVVPVHTTSASSDKSTQLQLIAELEKSSNPEILFNSYSEEQKALVKEYLTPVKFEESNSGTSLSEQAAGCYVATSSTVAKNALNMRLFEVLHRVDWCSNGSVVTSISKYPGYEIYAPLTRFNKFSEDYVAGKGTSMATAVTTGSFITGTYGIDLMEQTHRLVTNHSR